jgi:hypothetical protein
MDDDLRPWTARGAGPQGGPAGVVALFGRKITTSLARRCAVPARAMRSARDARGAAPGTSPEARA